MVASAQPDLRIVHAYRHLYRVLLHAVQFSSPNRYVARDQLRAAFRHANREQFDQHKISKTLEFLHYATRERGLEHRLVKNLLHTAYRKHESLSRGSDVPKKPLPAHIQTSARIHYDMTVAMLNDSMGLCLR